MARKSSMGILISSLNTWVLSRLLNVLLPVSNFLQSPSSESNSDFESRISRQRRFVASLNFPFLPALIFCIDPYFVLTANLRFCGLENVCISLFYDSRYLTDNPFHTKLRVKVVGERRAHYATTLSRVLAVQQLVMRTLQ